MMGVARYGYRVFELISSISAVYVSGVVVERLQYSPVALPHPNRFQARLP